jgi:hypothetical protein
MNGFSRNWSSENSGADFPGLGLGFTDIDFIRDGQKKAKA